METLNMKKIVLAIAIVLIAIIAIPVISNATNENLALVEKDGDYIIYINEKEEASFKFAFTNDNTLNAETVPTTLTFVANWTDTNNKSIACLEDGVVDKTKPIYMWIEVDGNYTSTELNLEDAISQSEMADVESLTKVISVDATQSTTTLEDVDGVATSVTLGQINITDDKECDYKYQLIKIDGKESETAKKLIKLVDSLQTEYEAMTMYNKVLTTKEVRDLYDALGKEAKWSEVKDMVIAQPADSKAGDQYIVLIQKISDKTVVKSDIQFLVCEENYENQVVKEKAPSEGPNTYDNMTLFIILGIIVLVAVIVVIRLITLKSKKDEE